MGHKGTDEGKEINRKNVKEIYVDIQEHQSEEYCNCALQVRDPVSVHYTNELTAQ